MEAPLVPITISFGASNVPSKFALVVKTFCFCGQNQYLPLTFRHENGWAILSIEQTVRREGLDSVQAWKRRRPAYGGIGSSINKHDLVALFLLTVAIAAIIHDAHRVSSFIS
jgi:hypothetical protein